MDFPTDRERCRPVIACPHSHERHFPTRLLRVPRIVVSSLRDLQRRFEDKSKGCPSWVDAGACRIDRARGGWLSVKGQRAAVQASRQRKKEPWLSQGDSLRSLKYELRRCDRDQGSVAAANNQDPPSIPTDVTGWI